MIVIAIRKISVVVIVVCMNSLLLSRSEQGKSAAVCHESPTRQNLAYTAIVSQSSDAPGAIRDAAFRAW